MEPLIKKEEYLHNLRVINAELKLDDFRLKGVTGYEIKSSTMKATEITIKMLVQNADITKGNLEVAAPEVPDQEQPVRFVPEDSNRKYYGFEISSKERR